MVHDWDPYREENLIKAMDAACEDAGAESCQGWFRYAKGLFPWCLAKQNIACDVDAVLWRSAVAKWMIYFAVTKYVKSYSAI